MYKNAYFSKNENITLMLSFFYFSPLKTPYWVFSLFSQDFFSKFNFGHFKNVQK